MKHIITAILCGVFAFLPTMTNAKGDSPWVEVQTVVLPHNVEIHEGLTRNGNPKAWIVIEDMNITVSPSNVEKWRKGEVELELVKWQHKEKGTFRYSTRQVKSASASKSKNIDLMGLFR